MKDSLFEYVLKDQTLIAKRVNSISLEKKGFLSFILENTSFLSDSASMSERLYCIYNSITSTPFCSTCGQQHTTYVNFTQGYRLFCSSKCSSLDPNEQQKRKNTCIAKYGTDNPMKSDQVKEKLKQVFQEKYGVDSYSQTQQFKDKYIKASLEKYGSIGQQSKKETKQTIKIESTQKVPNIETKYQTHLSKIDSLFSHSISLNDYIKKGDLGTYNFTCKTCNTTFSDYLSNKIPKCPTCFPNIVSQPELEIKQYILDMGISEQEILINSTSILNGKQLDLFIPQYNLAIQYNGLLFNSIGKSKTPLFENYQLESNLKRDHLQETQLCQEKGIQLLHIFENEWLNPIKQDIWKSIISSKLGQNQRVYARNLTVRLVSYQESCQFLDVNHLQGGDKSSIRLGLYTQDGELLSLMTFGKSRYDKKVTWELHRFANKKLVTIVGGASRIFTYFKNNYLQTGESIVSYADRRHSNGNLYIKLGFTLSHTSDVNYFYFKENSFILESRLQYQKHKLIDKLTIFDENLTESENMYNNGYRKVYDCGNFVYIFKK